MKRGVTGVCIWKDNSQIVILKKLRAFRHLNRLRNIYYKNFLPRPGLGVLTCYYCFLTSYWLLKLLSEQLQATMPGSYVPFHPRTEAPSCVGYKALSKNNGFTWINECKSWAQGLQLAPMEFFTSSKLTELLSFPLPCQASTMHFCLHGSPLVLRLQASSLHWGHEDEWVITAAECSFSSTILPLYAPRDM